MNLKESNLTELHIDIGNAPLKVRPAISNRGILLLSECSFKEVNSLQLYNACGVKKQRFTKIFHVVGRIVGSFSKCAT